MLTGFVFFASSVFGQDTAKLGEGAVLRSLDKVGGVSKDHILSQGETLKIGNLMVILGECRYPLANPSGDAFTYLKVTNEVGSKDFFTGFICQVILLPIIAFILIKIIPIPVEIALGIMIIAAAPGGVTSNVLTKFANGDVALSVTLTSVVSMFSIISVPFIIFNSAELLGVTNASGASNPVVLRAACSNLCSVAFHV